MVKYNKRLQDLFHEYETSLGRPGTLPDAVRWGLANGKISEPKLDPVAALVTDLKHALRSETRTDRDGRAYRANAAVTYTNDGGVQESLWGSVDLNTTPYSFVVEHFAQRRKGVVDDNVKLKTDVDHYNSTLTDKKKWIQLVLDYTDDVAEREAMRDGDKDAAE